MYIIRCDYSRLAQLSSAVENMGAAQKFLFWVPMAAGAPVFSNLAFVKCAYVDICLLAGLGISDVQVICSGDSDGDYLQFPDSKIDMLKIILESGDDNILVNQQDAPKFLKGDLVEVLQGPFAGLVGRELRFRSQRRVFLEIPGLGIFGSS